MIVTRHDSDPHVLAVNLKLSKLFFSSPNTVSTCTDSSLTWWQGAAVSKGKGRLLTWYVTDPVLQTSVGNPGDRDWREWQGWSLTRLASWDLFLRLVVDGHSICLRLDPQLHTYSAPDILQGVRRRRNRWKMTRSFGLLQQNQIIYSTVEGGQRSKTTEHEKITTPQLKMKRKQLADF